MIDRLRQMAIFAKTIDHGSFRGAARELNLSPSVISHHISQLEEHLGVALLYRSTRNLTLTQEGEKLLAATRKMLEAVEGELTDLAASAGEPSGSLRVTLPSVLTHSNLLQKMAHFSVLYPRIQISLDVSDQRKDLINDGFDLAIRMGAKAKNSANTRKLFTVTRKLVASKSYLNHNPPVTEPEDLKNLSWITLLPAQNTPHVFTHLDGRSVKISPNTQISTNDVQSSFQLAKHGAGITITPDFLVAQNFESEEMSIILPDWKLQAVKVFAAWPVNAPKDGLIHLLLNHLGN